MTIAPFSPATTSPARPTGSLVTRYAGDVDSSSFKDGYTAGSAIGAGLGTVTGAIVGGAGTVGVATWRGAKLGGSFGVYGAIAGGVVSMGLAALEERYVGAGTKAGSMIGYGIGTLIGGLVGGAIGSFQHERVEG